MHSKVENDKFLFQFHSINDVGYQNAWDFQKLLHENLKSVKSKTKNASDSSKVITKSLNHVVFCEHKHVITLGKSGKLNHLNSSVDNLEKEEIEFFKINRGGDITYHGPGQITGYLIFDLEQLYTDVHRFVRDIEEIVIRFLHHFDIKGERLENYTGVWINKGTSYKKICAIGVHLSRWVSMHGFALNIDTDLKYFNHIIPCGINEQGMELTSLSEELGKTMKIEDVQDLLLEKLVEVFDAQRIEE